MPYAANAADGGMKRLARRPAKCRWPSGKPCFPSLNGVEFRTATMPSPCMALLATARGVARHSVAKPQARWQHACIIVWRARHGGSGSLLPVWQTTGGKVELPYSSSSIELVSSCVSRSMPNLPALDTVTMSGMYSSVCGWLTLAANLSELSSTLSKTSPSSIPVLR